MLGTNVLCSLKQKNENLKTPPVSSFSGSLRVLSNWTVYSGQKDAIWAG